MVAIRHGLGQLAWPSFALADRESVNRDRTAVVGLDPGPPMLRRMSCPNLHLLFPTLKIAAIDNDWTHAVGSTTEIESTIFCGYRRIGLRLRSVAHDAAGRAEAGEETVAKRIRPRSLDRTDSDVRVLWFSDYGVERIPSIGLPPDAYIQVAIQLARYEPHGNFAATNETATAPTRAFDMAGDSPNVF
ncbi:hypothetical protein EDB85DRAFT_2196949 [Lactarius pseudohatsudake]|nr:hypothetical protein EDB85DRAFT_2196949 [Lactarius pseudohatsudake]